MKKSLFIMLLVCLVQVLSAQPHWNNLEVYRVNKLQPHDRIVPDGDWTLNLNGMWRFSYYDNPVQAAREHGRAAKGRGDSIRVPGNIELQGYGVPVYVNMKNEFPSHPPYVPADYNPVGIYERHFSVPSHWNGRRVIAKFGAVGGAMYLYVNGREVGYSEDSKTPAEWDITRYLHAGRNHMEARVVRWSNGSYLECQDMWRMSGITRDVVLYSVPREYIGDLRVVADLDTLTYRQGRVEVLVDLNHEVAGGAVEMQICGRTVRKRLDRNDWFASLSTSVGEVVPWCDSTPALYPLTVRLFNAAGRETECITKQVGFRRVEIKRGLLCLNGQPMEIRGVNRHEHSMEGGHYITLAEMREDIRLMKSMGINAVRTSHYPNDELWYDLCDSAGIYLWDEANVESHAQGYGAGSLAKKKEWLNPILDRIYNMYRRDRNHPSVIVWSLGNECGNGICMEEAYRILKSKDPTRPVVYERAELESNTDIVAIMYPSLQFLSEYARNPRNSRPYIMAEYCHAMGNSMGGLKDYWDTIDKYPQLQGGFIWDWIDQSFLRNGCWVAGGDLGQLFGIEDDDAFCANGILAADRTPHPCAAEVEAVYTRGHFNAAVPLPPPMVKSCALDYDIHYTATKQSVHLENGRFALTVRLSDGAVTSYVYHGRELLATPLRWHFWRPPTENDLVDPHGARAWQGLDALQAELIAWAPAVSTRDNEGDFELHLLYRLTAPDGAVLRVRQLLDVNPAGQFQLSYQVVPGGHFAALPMLGFQMGLDTTAYAACSFYGNIFETYADRRAAQRVGLWYKSLADLSKPQYVVPQEQGRREARWVSFGNADHRLCIVSPHNQPPLGFSVRRWSDSTLTAARRWCDVGPEEPFYTVTIDHLAAGLGTATCGPGVADRHLLSGDSVYTYRFLLDPTGTAASVEPFRPHRSLQDTISAGEDERLRVASVQSNHQPAAPYGERFPALLCDGRRAVAGDWQHGWAGFQGHDTIELLLTLEQYADLKAVSLSTCHSPADWVLGPLDVQVQWSIDGRKWSSWQSLDPLNPPADRYKDSRRVTYRLATRRARKVHYVRLRVVCLNRLPVWHPYAGEPAWLMLDEIELTSRE